MQRLVVLVSCLLLLESLLTATAQTSPGSDIPSCVDGTATANTQRCFMWSYDVEQDRCSTMPMTELPLLFGGGSGMDVELEYVYQPGYPMMTYHNHFLCIWNVTFPEDPCIFAEYTTHLKDFHTNNPSADAPCENQDHAHIRYEKNRNEYHCGNRDAHNCPISNCIAIRTFSEEPMSITFRSDSNGYDTGFLGIISLHTKQNCASRTKRQQQIDRYPPIEVPITHLCDDKECACNGSCYQPAAGVTDESYTEEERQAAQNIILDKSAATAFAYANSANQFLLRVARRAIVNYRLYETTLPTISQRLSC